MIDSLFIQSTTILMKLNFPMNFDEPQQYLDEIWDYSWPSVVTFCTAAIGFKVLMWFLNAARGD